MTDNVVMKITHHSDETQTFEFPSGFISDYNVSFEVNPQQLQLALFGPMGNIGNDFEGVGKTITINGVLYDQSSSVVTNNNITTNLHMKYWLESLVNGFQRKPVKFWSVHDEYSLRNSGGTLDLGNGTLIPGNWLETTGYIINYSFGDTNGSENVESRIFSITIWVAGQ